MTELKTKKRSSYELPIKTNYLIFKNGRAKWIRTIEMTGRQVSPAGMQLKNMAWK